MRALLISVLALLALPVHASEPVDFTTVDIYIDSAQPFAAWQFRLADRNSMMTIVGVENGDSEIFSEAPYFDRDAVGAGSADRIIVADFSLAESDRLPSGRVRIATLHIMLSGSGQPDFDLQLVTAVTRDGDDIDAEISLRSDTGSTP